MAEYLAYTLTGFDRYGTATRRFHIRLPVNQSGREKVDAINQRIRRAEAGGGGCWYWHISPPIF